MEREICFMLPFGADYVIFWRKKWSFMLPFGADHVTFWRRPCYLLAQTFFVLYYVSGGCSGFYNPIKYLIKNLMNSLLKYLTKEKACFKNFLGKFLWLFPLIAAQ